MTSNNRLMSGLAGIASHCQSLEMFMSPLMTGWLAMCDPLILYDFIKSSSHPKQNHHIEMACLPALCTSAVETKLPTWTHIHVTPVDGRHFRGAFNAWAVLVPLNLAYRSRSLTRRDLLRCVMLGHGWEVGRIWKQSAMNAQFYAGYCRMIIWEWCQLAFR